MSAFMLENRRLCVLAESLANPHGRMGAWYPIPGYGTNRHGEPNPVEDFARTLHAMNSAGVNECPFEWSCESAERRPIALLKLLQCYLYQCCEGDVPESTLYKTLDEIKGAMQARIISELPEYEAAPWG